MPFFLFEAVNRDGRAIADAVTADSVQEAHALLVAQGCRDIAIHTDLATASLHQDLGRLDPEQRQRVAAARIAQMHASSRFASHLSALRHTVMAARTYLAVAAMGLAAGLWRHDYVTAVLSGLYLSHPLALLLWGLLRTDRYRQLQAAMVHGRWTEALRLIAGLRRRNSSLPLLMDLDFREAQVRIRLGDPLPPLLEKLRLRWQGGKDHLFESRCVGLYLAAGDDEGYLAMAKASLAQAPGDTTRQLELAMAEARAGSVSEARRLLDGADRRLQALLAARFRAWIEAVLALRAGENAIAERALSDSVKSFRSLAGGLPMAELWAAWAEGERSLALARLGRKGEAEQALAGAWPVLRHHAGTGLREALRREVGLPAGQA